MSETSEKARAAAKDKAERLSRSDPHARVDASGYAPEGALDGDVQTGPRPVSRRQFRRGGKVDGMAAAPRADRKRRASGGPLTADSYLNRNVKTANEERAGTKHIGGMKRGGRAQRMAERVHKLIGGALTPKQKLGMMHPIARAEGGKVHKDAAQDRKLIHKEVHEMGCKCNRCEGGRIRRATGGIASKPAQDLAHSSMRGPAINDGTRPTGGRLARKGGGRAKKGTNVNIIIAPQGGGAPAAMPRPMPTAAPATAAPVGLHQGAPPIMPAAGVAPAGMPMRARGGRTYPIEAGAGSGLGRLEKAKSYG